MFFFFYDLVKPTTKSKYKKEKRWNEQEKTSMNNIK